MPCASAREQTGGDTCGSHASHFGRYQFQSPRSFIVAVSVRNPEIAQSVGFIWVFPLVFASSAFVPTAHMPDTVHTFADINPVTLVVNSARALTIGHGHALAPTLETLAWLAALLLILVPLSVRGFRRA